MDYQVSARKYRPATFEDVIGQPHVVRTLVNAITTDRIAHAFLFSGTRGVGKTTVARILAKALNCERGPTGTPCNACPNCLEITQGTSVDVIEIDGASNTGVDDVREIRENVKFAPFRGHYRVYIIDEVHMLSNSAFNALLKTLEEPPAHVKFIFATTEIHKIPATILSRCQHYNFRRIPRAEIIQRLRHVATENGIEVEDRSLAAIARASEGSMRDALSLLDQAVAFAGTTIRHSDLETLLGSVPQEHVRAMISAIVAQDSPAAVRVIAEILDQGHDLRVYCGDLVEHVRNLLVASVVPPAQGLQGLIDLSDEEVRQIAAEAKAFTADQLQELFRIFSQAEDVLRVSAHPRFTLEATAVRATRLFLNAAAALTPTVSSSAPASGAGQAGSDRRAGQPDAQPQKRPEGPVAGRPGDIVRPARPQPAAAGPVRAGIKAPPAAAPKPAPLATEPASSPAQSGQRTDAAPPRSVGLPAALQAGPSAAQAAPRVSASPPASAAAPRTPEAGVCLKWEEVLERVETRHPSIAAFLTWGTLIAIQDNQVIIGYPKTASVARAMLEKEENHRAVTAVCTEVAGRSVGLRVVELADGQEGASIAQLRATKERDRREALLERTRSHPLVKQTLEIFGGELAEVRQASPRKETR